MERSFCILVYSYFRSVLADIFSQERSCIMKGYDTSAGYMGYVDGKYILFCSEDEYLDYILIP